MTSLILANLVLALAWAAVSGSFSGINLLFGFVLGAIALLFIRERVGTGAYLRRIWAILVLSTTFLKELVLSAVRVAVMVLSPRMNMRPGFLAFPLEVESDAEIALLANMISLTPGTLSVDVSDDRKTLFIHFMDVGDAEAAKRDITNGFERQIREVFE